MNAPEKLFDRSKWIGGSDVAPILGIAPETWEVSTPLGVYLEKTGQNPPVTDPKKLKIFRRGKRAEPEVVDDLIEDLGVKVVKRSSPERPNRYVDPEYSFLAAEIDFEWEVTPQIATEYGLDPALIGTVQNGEVKTHHIFAGAKFGDEGTDEVPYEYLAQAFHGQKVSGRYLTLFAVRATLDDLRIYFVPRDDEIIGQMRARVVAFWMDHLAPALAVIAYYEAGLLGIADLELALRRYAPQPIRLQDVLQLFRKTPASVTEASEEIVALAGELHGLKDQAKAIEEGIEEKKFAIGRYILGEAAIERPLKARGGLDKVQPTAAAKPGQHVLTYCGRDLLLVNLQQQVRLDNDRIRKDYPEVAAECSRQIQFFKFERPRVKRGA